MRGSGLRVRMAVSYVLVTVAAVVLVDGVVLGILLPGMLANSSRAGQAATVTQQAAADAKRLSEAGANIARKLPPGTSSTRILQLLAGTSAATALGLAGSGRPRPSPDHSCMSGSVEAMTAPDGTVIASTNPLACPPGTHLGFASLQNLARQKVSQDSGGQAIWAVGTIADTAGGRATPAANAPARATSAKAGPRRVLGGLLVAAPGTGGPVSLAQLRPLLDTGGLVLALVIPVGTVFGLLSTRRLIRRIKRLADVTTAVASGDFRPRVPVSAGDEIGRLEDAFNQMTGRLSAALDQERRRAGADARRTERARIARELHDSISQDLFSLSLLAAGLGKALRGDSALRPEVSAMERTATQAMREMQALLLELRPVALEDAGLGPALADLCQAYQTRLAIRVSAELGEVSLDPPAEHAVLRVVQEAVGNAVRHADPGTIWVRLDQRNGAVTVEVRDDGRGFDPQDVLQRHGLGLVLMRERVIELGGEFQLSSSPGEGTAIVVRLPGRPGGQP